MREVTTSAWRRRPASTTQRLALQRSGIDVPPEITRADARALLRVLRCRKALRPVDVTIVSGKCSVCEVRHHDTTPAACRAWAWRRYTWLLGELARLHALLQPERLE